MSRVLIAIDGPAGSGKSTLAKGLARELGLAYVNTGLMYRALTAKALADGADLNDGAALAEEASAIAFTIGGADPGALLVDGASPGPELHTPEVEAKVSAVARHPQVRAVMRALQRDLGTAGAVMEGRDIGTVVFPDATVKFFLGASHRERVARRIEERGSAEDLAAAIAQRDAADGRVNPLRAPDDAVEIDSTELGIQEVLELALDVIRERI